MNRYRVYGLTVETDCEFPEISELAVAKEVPQIDVRIFLCERREIETGGSEFLRSNSLPDGTPWLNCARFTGGYLLTYAGFAEFLVDSAGGRITCNRAKSGVSEATIRHLVLDQVFPMALNLRGCEAIHATAIVTGQGACAFSGPTGSGKSTLAASFFLAGFRALGDDCLPLISCDGVICVLPGYPGMRLWSDSIAALSLNAAASAPIAFYTTKRRILGAETAKEFPREPLPLRRVFRLIRGEEGLHRVTEPAIERVEWRDAIVELVSSSFPLDITDRKMLERHFRFMERVATTVPVRRLTIPDDLDALPDVRRAVLADLDE
jgi:hypothetical protein